VHRAPAPVSSLEELFLDDVTNLLEVAVGGRGSTNTVRLTALGAVRSFAPINADVTQRVL